MKPSTDKDTASDSCSYLHKNVIFLVIYFNFKTCTVQTDVEISQPNNQVPFMLHELVCHSKVASYPYTFASYSYSCKILQPYVAASVRMHSDAVLSSTGTFLIKTVKK